MKHAIKDAEAIVVLALIVIGLFSAAAGLAHDYRGGNPRATISQQFHDLRR